MELFSNGIKLDTHPDKFGDLKASNDIINEIDALRTRMVEDGYLLFRDFIERDIVLQARREILLKFAIIGEIDIINYPLMDAIYSKHSLIENVNLIAFTESIRTGLAYEKVVLNDKLIKFYEKFFGGEVRCFDFKWPRFVRPGEGCGLHCDAPYVSRGTKNLLSSWIPLGDVSTEEGALIVLENSHKLEKLKGYISKDADQDKIGWLSTNPIELQNNIGGRWLTTNFKAGDVICFSTHLAHGTLDNCSPINKCRLTSDTRYQLANDPLDERWNGENFNPHGGNRVFMPGLVRSNNNVEFQEEWKDVDELGRLVRV